MSPAENHLIELLPRKHRLRLLAICEPADLTLNQRLCEAGAVLAHVYFPVESLISQTGMVDGRLGIEIATIGSEGMLGAHLALGVTDAPWRAGVQSSGGAWRCTVGDFRRELADSPPLQRGLHRYLHVLSLQLASAATCLGFHQLAPRLARWLLARQDHATAEHFHVTHDEIAAALGVRRVGVTLAAGRLQRSGLVRYRRGELTVLDRPGLQAVACACYAADHRVYELWMR